MFLSFCISFFYSCASSCSDFDDKGEYGLLLGYLPLPLVHIDNHTYVQAEVENDAQTELQTKEEEKITLLNVSTKSCLHRTPA